MASKQLGKLRQWAGEVISSRDKTQPSGEFMALEQDVETRKKGIDKLYVASRDYLEYISHKQHSDAVPGEDPMMQTEALGVVMIGHGEDLGDASALGRSLAMFGRARCRVAAMQNIYAVTFTDTFIAYLERTRTDLDDYAVQRKKLESRRLAYDAAISKAEKTYKKEKDRKDAEEELAKAKSRYEEIAEAVRARMTAIREDEVEQQRELRNFVKLETKFVEQYLEVLREVNSEWPEPNTYADLRIPTSSSTIPHNFSRTSTGTTDSKDSDVKQTPPVPSRFGSQRSNRSVQSVSSKKSASTRSTNQHESSSESEDDTARSRPSSRASRKMSAKISRPQSRQSKARSRSGSVTTIGTAAIVDTTDDTTSVKSSGKHKKASSGVASWVGDAVTSVMSRNKSRNTDIENFAALADKDEDDHLDKDGTRPKHSRKLSNRSTKSNRSSGGRSRSQSVVGADYGRGTKKVMKALYDFSGSSDELSFKAGEEIVVINEVLDDWWLGETGGRRGLFPTNYTVLTKAIVSSAAPTKLKSASNSSILGLGQLSRGSSKLTSEDEESRRTLVEPSESEVSMTEDEHDGDSVNGWHPVDTHHHSSGLSSPVAISIASEDGDAAPAPHQSRSVVSDDDFNKKLSVSLAKLNVQQAPSRSRSPGVAGSAIDVSASSPSVSPTKRIPPPPPPRRQVSNTIPNGPPPLPFRNLAPSRTHSSSTALHSLVPPAMDRRAHSETSSPFESQSELSFDTVATTFAFSTVSCDACGCEDFVEDPFRGRGLCANCTHAHA